VSNWRSGSIGVLVASLLLAISAAQAAADAERGNVLYETRCKACHASSVHNREARKAKSFANLRAQVLRWSAQVGGGWTAGEIDDMTLYLNRRYYHFPCPQDMCKSDQALLIR
jgi:mono/diheme cytochrome c family protein